MRSRLFSRVLLFAFCLTLIPVRSLGAPAGYRKAGNTENVFFFGDHGYQVEYRYDIENKFRNQITKYIENYNQFLSGKDKDVYFYFVNNSRSIDFTEDLNEPNRTFAFLCDSLTCVDHAACLEIDSFDTYMKYFYQTDHHWNHVGAQKGYEDIVRLLLGEKETPYQPVEEVVFDAVYNGSYVQRTGVRNASEHFAAYRYRLPEIKLTVNGKKKTVGRQAQYFTGKYSKNELASHFATFYGGDWGELVYDTGREDRENLLILCNSYGCSVRHLICAHFHKTYVVDMREYLSQTHKSMKIQQYLTDHHISKVLILGDVSYFLYGKLLH